MIYPLSYILFFGFLIYISLFMYTLVSTACSLFSICPLVFSAFTYNVSLSEKENKAVAIGRQ